MITKNPCSQCPESAIDMSVYPAENVPDWNSSTCKCCYITHLIAATEEKVKKMCERWAKEDED